MAVRIFWSAFFVVCFPVGSFWAIRSGIAPVWLGAGDFMLALFVLAAVISDVRSPGFPLKLAGCMGFGGVAMTVLFSWRPDYLSYLPFMAISASFAWLFGKTLRAGGGEPLITHFARMERGGQLPDELVAYTRRLTWAWTALFGCLLAESLVLAACASVETYLLFANSYNYLLVGGFFVGEYLYRRIRYRRYPHASPLAFLHMLIKANVLDAGKQR